MLLRPALVVLACFSLIGRANGDEASDADARQLFQAGRDAFERHEYQRAYDAFRQSYVISQRPELLFNMSSALKELGRPHDAADELRAYLRVVPAAPDRAQIEERILTLEETQRILDRDRAAAKARSEATAAPVPVAAPSVTQAAAPSPAVSATAPEKKRSRAWIWATVAGVVVAGAVVGLTVGLVPNNATPPSTQGGTQRAMFP